jgi:DNA-binding transcriptional LysR family regulator
VSSLYLNAMINETKPVNRAISSWLRAHGNSNPPPGPDWTIVDGYELHSHPELCEYLDGLIAAGQKVNQEFYHGYRVHSFEGVIFAFAAGNGIALRHPCGELRSIMKLARRFSLDWILIRVLRRALWKPMYDVAYRYACGDLTAYVSSDRLESADIEEARRQMIEMYGSWSRIVASLHA